MEARLFGEGTSGQGGEIKAPSPMPVGFHSPGPYEYIFPLPLWIWAHQIMLRDPRKPDIKPWSEGMYLVANP